MRKTPVKEVERAARLFRTNKDASNWPSDMKGNHILPAMQLKTWKREASSSTIS